MSAGGETKQHPHDGARADRRREDARTLAAAVLSSVSSFMPVLMTGALAVQITDVMPSTGYAVVAVAVSASFAVGGFAALVIGRLVDRIGWHLGARMAAALTATSLVGAMASGTRPLGFVLAIAFGGLGLSLAQTASNLALLEVRTSSYRGTLFGVKQATSPAASLLAGLAVPLVGVNWGWQPAFGIAVVLPALAAAAVPTRGNRTSAPRPDDRTAISGADAAAPPRPPAGRARTSLWVTSVAGGMATIAIGAITAFLAPTAVAAGLSEAAAGLLIVFASLGGIFVRIFGGLVVDRGGRGAGGAFTAVVLLLAVGVVGFLMLATGRPGWVTIGALLAFGGGWSWPGLLFYGVVTTNPVRPGRASGIVEAGLQLGTATGPITFAAVSAWAGFAGAWVLMAVTAGAGAALLWFGAASPHRSSRPR